MVMYANSNSMFRHIRVTTKFSGSAGVWLCVIIYDFGVDSIAKYILLFPVVNVSNTRLTGKQFERSVKYQVPNQSWTSKTARTFKSQPVRVL